jgi:hypothetical protein
MLPHPFPAPDLKFEIGGGIPRQVFGLDGISAMSSPFPCISVIRDPRAYCLTENVRLVVIALF